MSLVWGLLVLGCAQVESPSGGPVDQESPRVVGLFPDSGSVAAHPDTISILFSKGMNRKSVRDWTFLSPSLAIEKRHWDHNRLDLILAAPAESATTYSLLLGAEVVDERGNPLGPWEASFSTGTTLDDGVLRGKVLSGRLKSSGVYLYLWRWADSLGIERGDFPDPVRMGQVAKDGSFEIGSVSSGSPFRLAALYDVNEDRGYDPNVDLLVSLETPIELADTTRIVSGLEIYLVLPDEPGEISGNAIDSTCVGQGIEALNRIAWEADSLGAMIGRAEEAVTDTLYGFGQVDLPPVDTLAIRMRLDELETLRGIAREDSSRCATPIIVRLWEADTILVNEVRGDSRFTFRDLAPGIYRVTAFRDLDGNGQPNPSELQGRYGHPIELRPGRHLTGLDFELTRLP